MENLKELMAAQQGELDAVLLYQALAKLAKTEKRKEQFLSIAKDEGRHASIIKTYTHEVLKPKKGKAILVSTLYRLLGHTKTCQILAKGEISALDDYKALVSQYPKIQAIMDDELRHAEILQSE